MPPLLSRISNRVKDLRRRTRLFDFLVPGVHKGGTTWLHRNIRQHPEVQLPFAKELSFFNYKHLNVKYDGLLKDYAEMALKAAAKRRANGKVDLAAKYEALAEGVLDPNEDWYRKVFEVVPNSKISGEFTPEYFCIGEAGIRDIHSFGPDARIIIFIRDPVSRMISSLSMAANMNPGTAHTSVLERPLFQRRGDYVGNLPFWDEIYGDQILYVPFQDIGNDPRATLARIERFIGLSPFDGYKMPERKFNSFTGKTDVDADALNSIKRFAEPQRRFLEERFGPEFCARI